MWKRRRVVSFFILILGALSAFFIAKPVMCWAVKTGVSYYCRSQLGATLSVKEVVWEEGRLVFKEGRVQVGEQSLACFATARIARQGYGCALSLDTFTLWPLNMPRKEEQRKGRRSLFPLHLTLLQGNCITPTASTFLEGQLHYQQGQWHGVLNSERTSLSLHKEGPTTSCEAFFRNEDLSFLSCFADLPACRGYIEGSLKWNIQEHTLIHCSGTLVGREFAYTTPSLTARSPHIVLTCLPDEVLPSCRLTLEKADAQLYSLNLQGSLSAKIQYVDDHLAIDYEATEFVMESPSLLLETVGTPLQGMHEISLITGSHHGSLPLSALHYQQKNYDLECFNASAHLAIHESTLFFEKVSLLWEKLPLEGRMVLDILSFEDMALVLEAGCPEGDLASARRFLSHFIETPLSDLPLEGIITTKPHAAFFLLHLTPGVEIVSGSLKGEAFFHTEKMSPALDEGSVTFAYDYEDKKVTLEQLHMVSLLGTLPHAFDISHGEIGPNQWQLKGSWHIAEQPALPFLCTLKEHQLSIHSPYGQLHGSYHDGQWHCAHLEYLEYRGTARFDVGKEGIHLDHLTLAHPQMGRLVLTGMWERAAQHASGYLTIEALDLTKLLPDKAQHWGLMGTVSGQGTLSWNPSSGGECALRGEYRNFTLCSLYFGDGKDIDLRYTKKEGFHVSGLEALSHYRLGELHYDPCLQRAYFDGFDFKIPPEMFSRVGEIAQKLFPQHVNATTLDILMQLKQEEALCGRLWIDFTPGVMWLHLRLKDGLYYLNHQPLDIKDFSLVYDPKDLYVKTTVKTGQIESSLHIHADSQTLSSGTLALQRTQEEDLLTMKWRKDICEGYVIEEILGTWAGIECALYRSYGHPEALAFHGTLCCHPTQAPPLLPTSLQKWIFDHALAGEYHLKGDFFFPKNALFYPSFEGDITASDLACDTLKLASLQCHCSATPYNICFSNIALCDWAGTLFCDQLCLYKEATWFLDAKHIALHDVRLSRLDSRWTKRERGMRPLVRSFFIHACELNHLHGELANWSTLVGEGKLNFTNMPRRTLLTQLMTIPIEIAARIGLDPTTLIPVRGTVFYKLLKGKIHLLDVQDMYSDAKRSAFYLADNTPSYIGLDGSLHLCIKMKQYTLLMKLAELFTLTIQGSVGSPEYLLQLH